MKGVMGVVEGIMLKKVDTGEELALEMVSTPYFILNSVDWGVIQSTHHSYKYVNQIGVTVTGTSLETRAVEIKGWVIADSEEEMDERKGILNKFFNPQNAIDLNYKEYTIRFIPDNTVQYGVGHSENNEVIAQWKIKGTCPDPLFSSNFESHPTIAGTIAIFHFPLVMSTNLYERGVVFGYRSPSLTANVINRGAVPVGMRIVFRAKGAVENPQLIDVNTRQFIKINKTLVAEEEVEVNTIIGEKRVIGHIASAEPTNYFKYRDIGSSWLQLQVGDNLLRYDADDGLDNLEVYMYFYNKYLEVQECY